MNTTNTLDIPTPLTEIELQHLWAPVPEDCQQREEMIRISLRPELDADYTGPVELQDLRLALSPWLWSKAELASSPRSQALNQALAKIRAANPDMELDTMPAVVQWLAKELDKTSQEWELFPDHPDFWKDCGTVSLSQELGEGTFIPFDLELSAVYFYTDSGQAANSRLVVVQTRYDGGHESKQGPVGIFTSSERMSDHSSDSMGWLLTSGDIVLKNPVTGEQAKLAPGEVNGADEDYDDDQGTRRGTDAVFANTTAISIKKDQAPVWISGPLYYKAGRLYLTDTAEQALTLELEVV